MVVLVLLFNPDGSCGEDPVLGSLTCAMMFVMALCVSGSLTRTMMLVMNLCMALGNLYRDACDDTVRDSLTCTMMLVITLCVAL